MKLDKKYFESKQNELAVYRMKLSDALYGELELVVLRQIARDAREYQAGKDRKALIGSDKLFVPSLSVGLDERLITVRDALAALNAAKGE